MNMPARTDRSLLTEWRRTIDWPILIACAVLMGIGLLAALSAGPPAASRIGYADPYHFVYRQIGFVVIATGLLLSTSLLTVRWARRWAGAVFIGALGLMLIVLFLGHEAKGAQRWIRFAGFSLQPSELIKPALIVLAGWLFAQREFYPSVPWAAIAASLWAGTVGLLLLQPDVGQSALLTAAFLITFFIAGLTLRWAAAFGAGGIVLTGILFLTLPHFRKRLLGFFFPSDYDTYQIDKASEAIANGGLFGVGPGEGAIKRVLPDAHSDFVYAVLSEEFGLVLSLLVILLYVFIVIRGMLAARQIEDASPRASAIGLFALFGLQAAINISVNISLIPPKGMTLPLVSYGGSSLLGTALTLGFALALIRRRGAKIRWKRTSYD
ncbi:MAG: putative peptidoglycan glycosyltransferase FtsW [Hyphomonadaceae bacterium]